MVTILIPTAKRPHLLANALRSVSEQTAANEIVEVIVSENAGDSRSREVCKQFPGLPIKYIFRDPQMLPTEHGSTLAKTPWSGEFTAILHDDDWWTPDFLSRGIEALNSHPKSSVFCCSSYYVANEEDIFLRLSPILYFWFGANYPRIGPVWEMGMQEVLLASLLATPAHYSTIMTKAEAFRNSALIYDTGNGFDNDRMLIFELSKHGTLLYSPLPQAFYRLHAQQETTSHSEDGKTMQMCRTTEWMLDRSGETWESLGNLFYERAGNCPKDVRNHLHYLALQPWSLPILVKHLNKSSDVVGFYKQIRAKTRFKALIKPFCPPIILNKGKFLRNFFGM